MASKNNNSKAEKLLEESKIDTGQEEVKARCNDAFFAFMFASHLIVVIVIGFIFGRSPYSSSNNNNDDDLEEIHSSLYFQVNINSVIETIAINFFYTILLTLFTCVFLGRYPSLTVRLALLSNSGVSFLIALFGYYQKKNIISIFGISLGIFSIIYTVGVWGKIPFIASNIKAAFHVLKLYKELFIMSIFQFSILGLWTLLWAYVMIGVIESTSESYCDDWECEKYLDWTSILLLCLSYYWTYQVIKTIGALTVARTFANWLLCTDKTKRSTTVVKSSYIRSVTTSFGSVCVSSLLLTLMKSIHKVASYIRKRKDKNQKSFLFFCADCMVECLLSFTVIFQEWTIIFVGIHNLSYSEAASKVIELFEMRGLSTLLTQNVVSNLLFVSSVIISCMVGLFGLILSIATQSIYIDQTPTEIFGIAAVVGFIGSRIFMCVIESAVNSVIVLFAESPYLLQSKEPSIYKEMSESWSCSYLKETLCEV